MADIPSSSRDDDQQDNIDLNWLVDRPKKGSPAPEPVTPRSEPGEGYELVGGDDLAGDEAPPRPVVPPIPPPPRTSKPKRSLEEVESPRRAAPEPAATVDHVWTRWAEWGPTLILMALVAAAGAFVVYEAVAAGRYALSALLFLLCGAVLIVLTYPLVITLERPVRITPEQAVKDFYAALSHHLPHYRRMWLLLSSAGRTSGPFDSYGGFKSYWVKRLAELRGDRGGRFTPLRFEVTDFQADKSAGQTTSDAKFTVNVYLREPQGTPLHSFWVKTGLAKGPDRMWYLNKGTLPDERR